jgi:hypothetical protein
MTQADKAEKEFKNTLAFLKEYLNRPIAPVSDGSLRNYLGYQFLYRESDPFKDLIIKNKIKIMESGIFYKGGLKGKILKQTQLGTVIDYKVLHVSTMPNLLDKLNFIMISSAEFKKEEIVRQFISEYFNNLLNAFDEVAPIARRAGVRKRTIEKIREELAGWDEKAINKIPAFKKKIAMEIAETLIAHLPSRTPDLTIAARTKELLAAFGKEGMAIRTLTGKIAKLRGDQSVPD